MNVAYNKIYIMTLPRSGSTMLGQILGGHRDIFHIGESMYWELLDPSNTVCSCDRKGCFFLVDIYKRLNNNHAARPLLKLWQIVDKKYWPSKPILSDSLMQQDAKVNINLASTQYWLQRSVSSLNTVVDTFKQKTHKKVYIDNTKLYSVGQCLVNEADWGILVLLRDPRSIMSSYKNAGKRKNDNRTAESVLPFCLDFIKAVQKIKDQPNVIIVKYEDICNKPKAVIKNILKFIGIRYNDKIINFNKLPMNKRGHILKGNRLLHGSGKFIINLDDSWKNNLTQRELNILKKQTELVKLYKFFGYNL